MLAQNLNLQVSEFLTVYCVTSWGCYPDSPWRLHSSILHTQTFSTHVLETWLGFDPTTSWRRGEPYSVDFLINRVNRGNSCFRVDYYTCCVIGYTGNEAEFLSDLAMTISGLRWRRRKNPGTDDFTVSDLGSEPNFFCTRSLRKSSI